MKKLLFAIIFTLILPITVSADIEKEICDWSGGTIGCEGQSSFKEFKGYYKPPDPDLYVDPEGESIFKCYSLRECVLNYTNFFLGFLALAAVITIIYGGYLYVLAGGEAEKTEKGKKNIIYAVTGILIIMISYAIVNTVIKYAPKGEDDPGELKSAPGQSVSGAGYRYTTKSGQSIAIDSSLQSMTKKLNSSSTNIYEIQNNIDAKTQTLNKSLNDADNKKYLEQNPKAIVSLITEIESFYKNINNLSTYFPAAQSSMVQAQKHLDIAKSGFAYNYEKFLIKRAYADDTTDKIEGIYAMIICDLDNTESVCSAKKSQIQKIVSTYTSAKVLQNVVSDYNKLVESSSSDYDEIKSNEELVGKIDFPASSMIDNLKLKDQKEQNDYSEIKTVALELFKLDQKINNLQIVNAILTSSNTQGPAPLTIQLDASQSQAPENAQITEYNWILGEVEITGNSKPANVFDICTIQNSAAACTLTVPGSYKIGVRVKSNDTNTISGTVYINISVRPPVSKLNLKLKNQSNNNIKTVADYGNFNDPQVNIDNYSILHSHAKDKGIFFDASSSTDGFGLTNSISYFEFNFGDSTKIQSGSEKTATHKYKNPGIYRMKLKIKDSKENVDQKILNIRIETIISDFYIKPAKGSSETIFELDGSASKSDIASINKWDWNITKEEDSGFKEDDLDIKSGNLNSENLTLKFTEPGVYKIDLAVKDNASPENINSSTQYLYVESKSPIPIFTYYIPNPETKPGQVYFDASETIDPDNNDLEYLWNIDANLNEDFIFEKSTTNTSINPIISFLKTGEFNVDLIVSDKLPEEIKKTAIISKKVEIENILGIEISTDANVYNLNKNSESKVKVTIESQAGKYAEVDFSDGEKSELEFANKDGKNSISTEHVYTESGIYQIKATVYDVDGNENSDIKVIKIGDGTTPLASFEILQDNIKIADSRATEAENCSKPTVTGNKNNVFTFDASKSLNIDGTNRKLNYNWTIKALDSNKQIFQTSDLKKFTTKIDRYGEYLIELDLKDKDDPSKQDYAYFGCLKIASAPPQINNIQYTVADPKNITPLKLELKAIGAKDPDGEIVRYLWWYQDIADSTNEKLGSHTTAKNTTTLTINTFGKENEIKKYRLYVEITDNDNNRVNIEDVLPEANIPQIEVTNGPNKLPEITLSADRTYIMKGESVNISAKTDDPDGKIEIIEWDLDGDLIYNEDESAENDEKNCQNKFTCTYQYNQKNNKGYEVRAAVTDSLKAKVTSKALKIFVDSKAKDPVAAFILEKEPQPGELTVTVNDNSEIDPENNKNIKYIWDKDISTDSSGDKKPDNDNDEDDKKQKGQKQMTFTYPKLGTYEIKLTIEDDEGNGDSISQKVTFSDKTASKPIAEFNHQISTFANGKYTVNFNASASKAPKNETLTNYIWDFNLDEAAKDSKNTDNNTINDIQEEGSITPSYIYYPGTYKVKLTVETANANNSKTVTLNLKDPSKGQVPVATLKSKDPTLENYSKDRIELTGEKACVTFVYNATGGSSNYEKFIIDYNINFDLSGDGNGENDADFQSAVAGEIQYCYEKSWAKEKDIIAKLFVYDKNGQISSRERLIYFIPTQPGQIDARIFSRPTPAQGGKNNNKIVLYGDKGEITFDFTNSIGEGLEYYFDKNVYFDSNFNNTLDDDYINIEKGADGKPKPITEPFERSWGKTKSRLIIKDKYGQIDQAEVEIVFENPAQTNIISIVSSNLFVSIFAIIGIIAIIFYQVINKIKKYSN